MINQQVSVSVEGGTMPAYLARPEEGSGRHSAVIIIPEIFGITDEMKAIADHVAGAGGVALVINFYHRLDPDFNPGYGDDGMNAGIEAAKTVTRASLRADVSGAIAWLNTQSFVNPGNIGTWGFCIGGSVAFVTATLPGLKGAVCFYGSQITRPFMSGEAEGLADVNEIACPLLLVYGGDDHGISPEQIDRTTQSLESAGKEFQLQVYPNVGHAFFRHGTIAAIAAQRDASNQAIAQATADGWDLVLAFFGRAFDTVAPEHAI